MATATPEIRRKPVKLLLFLTGIGIVIAWYLRRGGYRGDGFEVVSEYDGWLGI